MTAPLSIDLRIEVCGDTVTGSAGDGGTDGERREFSGWLGLIGAIEALVEARREAPAPAPDPAPAHDSALAPAPDHARAPAPDPAPAPAPGGAR